MIKDTVYVVTDAEFDGPTPGLHSMMSFARVAVAAGGRHLGAFEAVLAPLGGHTNDPLTRLLDTAQPGGAATKPGGP